MFDFLKSKKQNASQPLSHFKFRNEMHARASEVVKNSHDLKAAGKKSQAIEVGRSFLQKVTKDLVIWEEPKFSLFLGILYNTAWKLGEEHYAKSILDIAIQGLVSLAQDVSNPGVPQMDLTPAYMRAGNLAERIPGCLEEAYRCYWMACETQPPLGCKMPASTELKANIHSTAKNLCLNPALLNSQSHADWMQRAAWHDMRMRNLAPNKDWDTINTSPGI